ncbi:type II toxin-antitoxin system VapC family toxin [Treponema sp. OMZ 792]|uniref:type II toxin-antitoxin system VapC family toxin n=1 Tax=unclassified Treponema TaxID=2638727 RepID=UPI0020A4D968|nr:MULTISPECIES: type II toxin-antitoxin system VapC family toxin [unclassified Treponema]UTC74927.1 type II toxin-antitoxin system VapC family toxin [Treponema sp. OMZ 792]UTC76718.1 type II toxin-antitoxin system VapC family toxin [Treponema sp. OMZ 799]UTC81321.1 type II toxin-antitoxin system VapC family toxin [Treponema sp. OMZ 798]
MIIILDVSAAIEILFQREKSSLFSELYSKAGWIIAPDLFVAEITNVLWKYYKAGLITYEDCIQYVQDGLDMVDDFIDANTLWKESLSEGIKNNHSIYDMYYLVLTRRNDGTLITNNTALAEICKKMKIKVCN